MGPMSAVERAQGGGWLMFLQWWMVCPPQSPVRREGRGEGVRGWVAPSPGASGWPAVPSGGRAPAEHPAANAEGPATDGVSRLDTEGVTLFWSVGRPCPSVAGSIAPPPKFQRGGGGKAV